MKKETRDYSTFKAMLTKSLLGGFSFHRIETIGDDGIPDVYVRTVLTSNWLEFKHFNLPKRDDTRVKPPFSAQQYVWLYNAMRLGERVWLVTYTDYNEMFIHYKEGIQREYINTDSFIDTAVYATDIAVSHRHIGTILTTKHPQQYRKETMQRRQQ